MRGVPLHRAAVASRLALSRSLVISAVMHSSIIGLIFSSSFNQHHIDTATKPQIENSFDISLIPLSALETHLPRGVPVPPQTPLELQATTPPQSKPVAAAPEHAPKKVASRVAPSLPKLQKRVRPKVDNETSSAKARSDMLAREKSLRTNSAANPAANSSAPLDATSSQPSAPQPFGIANGDATSLEQARISYQDMVAKQLARSKRYPERALIRRKTGEGSIRLEISADGSVSQMTILRSTNTPILDDELLAMVKRASPFPAFPRDLRKDRVAFVIPVEFRLGG
jgi:protein TonB